MASKKGKSEIIRMVSTAEHPTKPGKTTGFFKTKKLNTHARKVNGLGKLELSMYDPVAKKHALFKQQKDSK